jgi:hypothetical protein
MVVMKKIKFMTQREMVEHYEKDKKLLYLNPEVPIIHIYKKKQIDLIVDVFVNLRCSSTYNLRPLIESSQDVIYDSKGSFN